MFFLMWRSLIPNVPVVGDRCTQRRYRPNAFVLLVWTSWPFWLVSQKPRLSAPQISHPARRMTKAPVIKMAAAAASYLTIYSAALWGTSTMHFVLLEYAKDKQSSPLSINHWLKHVLLRLVLLLFFFPLRKGNWNCPLAQASGSDC